VNDEIFNGIMREYMETVTTEMNTVMDRTSLSAVFNEAHDCSAGLFFLDSLDGNIDADSVNIIARAQAEPVHIYASLYSTMGLVDYWRDDLHPGDVVVVNDPYVYGSHSADWTVMTPVFVDGNPVFFPCVRGHIIEHGSPIPGSVSPHFRDIWNESIRFQPLKLYARGERQNDVFEWLCANNRTPDIMLGDLNAMIGACRAGERRVVEVIEKYGFEKVIGGVRGYLDYSERRVRRTISAWPDGEYKGQAICDTDYAGNRDMNIDCAIRVKGDELEVDFTGSHDQVRGHVNSTFGSTASWVYTALSAIMHEIPVNSGFFRPVSIIAPKGSIVNPLSPAPVCTNTILIGSDIGDSMMKALEHVVPEQVGSVAADVQINMHFGSDMRYPEEPFFIHGDYLFGAVMSSAGSGVDGWGAWSAPHGSHRMPTVEMTEIQTPVFFLEAEYEKDTAAPGQWRGTPGFKVRKQNPPGQTVMYTIEVQSQHHPLPGWVGGSPGANSYIVLDHGGEREAVVEEFAFHYPSAPGEVILARKGGGGGWGLPIDRDPAAVLVDVENDLISIEAARRDYGVVIDPAAMRVDEAATAALRDAMPATNEGGEA
jgi:N-methylhydantoinase B